MTKASRVSAAALAACMLASQMSAAAEEWRITPLAQEGWSAQEQGEVDGPGAYSVKLVYETADVAFSIGCPDSYGLYITWDPMKALEGGILVPVKFSVDGSLLFERNIANNDRRDYSWLERGDGTQAAALVDMIWETGAGTLTIEGGGATSTIPFDEETNGYWSEEILFACGLL